MISKTLKGQWRLNTGVNSRPGGGTRDDAPASLQAWDPVRQEQVWEVLADDIWNAEPYHSNNLYFKVEQRPFDCLRR
ncbi:MAG: hypothetical protein CM1200mP40_09230 [Gammaproteobacteria bacterium]|nr:MAG: hypothetical protein CM1200mP40_09230 [Gammaproteobacteria bacterium]